MKNKKWEKCLSLLLALAMLFVVAACGSTSTSSTPAQSSGTDKTPSSNEGQSNQTDETVYTWRIGIGNGGTEEGNPIIYYMCRVAERAAELSGGRLEVEQYIGGTLGTNAELPQGLVDGTVDSAILPTQFFTSTVADLYALDLSGKYESADQILDILNNNDTIAEQHALDKGIHIAAWLKLYPRCTITVDEVSSVSDLKAKKLWFATSAVLSNKCTSVGAIPCNFSGSDLAVSLQNGTVDGAWCDMSMMNNFTLYDFAKYVIKAPGDPMLSIFCISDIWYQSLPADLQEIVMQVAAECAELQYARAEEVEAQLEQNLIDNGVQVVEPSAEFMSDFNAAIGDESEWLIGEYPAAEAFYNELMGYIENN